MAAEAAAYVTMEKDQRVAHRTGFSRVKLVLPLVRETTSAVRRAACGPEGAPDTAEQAAQQALLRDLSGNPSRPVTIDPAWLAWHGGAVKRLAEAVYDERHLPGGHLDAARLAVLADMLEEAGCCGAELLGHLRSPGPHVRGCWPLDLLLQRA
jgi:hypothetical protein